VAQSHPLVHVAHTVSVLDTTPVCVTNTCCYGNEYWTIVAIYRQRYM